MIWTYIYIKLFNNINILRLIIMGIYFIYCFKTSTFYLDGEDLDNVTSDRQYIAYNPGIVPTNQGFRVELDSRPIYELEGQSPNYVGTNHGFLPELNNNEIHLKYTPRIPHPSHYNNGNPHEFIENNIRSMENYNRIPQSIEPTRSQIEDQGYYSGNPNPHSVHIVNVSKPNFFKNLKDKTLSKYNKLEKKYDKFLVEEMKKKRELQEDFIKTRYIKKQNTWLCDAEIRSLRRQGYIVQNSKIIKIPSKPNKVYY